MPETDRRRTIKRSAKHGKLADQKFRQDKKRNKSATTDIGTFSLRPIIRKMKIPLLILCLAVIYGTCRAYNEENNNLIERVTNNGDYKLDYSNVAFERSLSRQKRTISIVDLILRLIGISNPVLKLTIDLTLYGLGVLTGRTECPKIEKISFEQILSIVFNFIVHPISTPITAFKTVICYVLNAIGSRGRALMSKGFELALSLMSKFIRKIFLPNSYRFLNYCKDNYNLPTSIDAMITSFNMLYRMLRIIGYVE